MGLFPLHLFVTLSISTLLKTVVNLTDTFYGYLWTTFLEEDDDAAADQSKMHCEYGPHS